MDKWTSREPWDGGRRLPGARASDAAKCPPHGTQCEIWAPRLLTLQQPAAGARTVREGFRQQVAPEAPEQALAAARVAEGREDRLGGGVDGRVQAAWPGWRAAAPQGGGG